jgi:hypothetical protein
MNRFGGHLGVAAFGVVAFALTVVAVTAIERLTGFNLFTFSLWVILPVGALLTGAAAASGYYFGSLFFHIRPNWFLLVQIIFVAAVAQIAIYYGEYNSLILDDGTKASTLVSFRDYLDISLTQTHLRIGRAAVDTGEVGSLGYWLAGIEFLGFIAGGVFVFLMLLIRPACKNCSRYLRKLLKHNQQFNDQEEFAHYYDTVFQHPVDSTDFSEWMHWQPHQGKPKAGTVSSVTTLLGCPHCKSQMISQEVKILTDREWKDVSSLSRNIQIPDGIDLKSVFKPA